MAGGGPVDHGGDNTPFSGLPNPINYNSNEKLAEELSSKIGVKVNPKDMVRVRAVLEYLSNPGKPMTEMIRKYFDTSNMTAGQVRNQANYLRLATKRDYPELFESITSKDVIDVGKTLKMASDIANMPVEDMSLENVDKYNVKLRAGKFVTDTALAVEKIMARKESGKTSLDSRIPFEGKTFDDVVAEMRARRHGGTGKVVDVVDMQIPNNGNDTINQQAEPSSDESEETPSGPDSPSYKISDDPPANDLETPEANGQEARSDFDNGD